MQRARWSGPSFRCHDQSDPRGHRFVLRVPGQAGGGDCDQSLAPLWERESVEAVPAPHQPDTIPSPCGHSCSCDQAPTSLVPAGRSSISAGCVHTVEGSSALLASSPGERNANRAGSGASRCRHPLLRRRNRNRTPRQQQRGSGQVALAVCGACLKLVMALYANR